MRMGSGGTERLFSQLDIFSVLDHQRKAALDEIARIEPNRLLNTPTEDMAGYIAQKYRIDLPQIDGANAVLEEPQETTIPVNDFGRRIEARATAYTLTVPFTGDREMFRVQPTTYDSLQPAATAHGSVLVISVISRSGSGSEVKGELNSTLAAFLRGYSFAAV